MLAPEEKPKLSTKPYLAATPQFKSGSSSPREFLERCLVDLTALEPKIGAFVHLNIEAARNAADASSARWRAGCPFSPIDGMPIGIKDIIETADFPTENGSPIYFGWRSERDGASVVALREAGAVILGKTVTTEFAATEPRGTRNPHDLRRTPGGSSSGSAAGVAAGMISAGLGTQVIGSIVRPASYCGCVGLKVSVGALNRGGSFDGLSQSVTGVLAATLEDAWQVASEIASRAGGDPGYPGLFGPTSGAAAAHALARGVSGNRGVGCRLPEREGGHERCAGAAAWRQDRGGDASIACEGCCGGGRDQGSAGAVDAHQCLGMALTAQHLSQSRCEQAQPRAA